MALPSKLPKYLASMVFVVGLAQNLTTTFNHGVATQDKPLLDPGSDVGRFLISQAGDQLRSGFPG